MKSIKNCKESEAFQPTCPVKQGEFWSLSYTEGILQVGVVLSSFSHIYE